MVKTQKNPTVKNIPTNWLKLLQSQKEFYQLARPKQNNFQKTWNILQSVLRGKKTRKPRFNWRLLENNDPEWIADNFKQFFLLYWKSSLIKSLAKIDHHFYTFLSKRMASSIFRSRQRLMKYLLL